MQSSLTQRREYLHGRRYTVSIMTYDALNRPRQTSYSDGTPTVTYAYDLAVPNGRGQLGSVSTASVVTRHTAFDAMGNITQSSRQMDGQTYAFYYSYNLAGALTRETYPSWRVGKIRDGQPIFLFSERSGTPSPLLSVFF
jgi:hypothetical protein